MKNSSEKFDLSHEIFVLDAYLKKALDPSRAGEITRNLLDDLLRTLDMIPLGDLQICFATDLRAPGWSFIQPITTSHISGHYFEKPGRQPNIRMDLYSCRSVEWPQVIETVHKHLDLADWRGTFIDRQIDPGTVRHMYDIAGEKNDILLEKPVNTTEEHVLIKRTKERKPEFVSV